MSKEILHRAKRTDTIEWVEGYYVKLKLTGTAYILTGDAEVEPCKKGVLIFRKYEVDPKTICQYTGLTDKNGRKIFEGDIVSAWSEGSHAIGRIKQRIDGLWLLYPAWQKEIMWGLCPNNKGETTVEVIGNIFDNPELLRGA